MVISTTSILAIRIPEREVLKCKILTHEYDLLNYGLGVKLSIT
jgi:hypothetical protein